MQETREYTTLDFFFSLPLSFSFRLSYFAHEIVTLNIQVTKTKERALQLHYKYFLLRFSILQELYFPLFRVKDIKL